MKRAEWEQAIVMAALLDRWFGGEVTIPISDIMATREATVEVHETLDGLVVRVKRVKPPLGEPVLLAADDS